MSATSFGAAATSAISAPEKTSSTVSLPVAATKVIYAGTLVAEDANGDAQPASDTAGLRVVGRAESTVDNSVGQATQTITSGEADDETITMSAAHLFSVGDRVVFPTLSGGSGLTAATTVYFVLTVPTSTTFTVSATLGGSTATFSTDITSGTVKRYPVSPVKIRRGVFRYNNSGTNAVTDIYRGKWVFVEDNTTVATTSTYKVKAGYVEDVDSSGVWINTTLSSLTVPTAVSLTSTDGTAAAASASLSNLAAETEKVGDDVRAIHAALVTAGLLR